MKKLRSRKKTVVLSSWLVVIFRILSYVINICLTGWSKRFYHNIIIIYFYSPKIISSVTFFFVLHLQMIKQKVYLLLANLVQLTNLTIDLVFYLFFWLSFFQLIVLSKPDFLIVQVFSHYLELIKLQWNIKFCISY